MEYKIEGTPLPVVICTLSSGESMISEGGGMAWMSPNMKMSTKGGGAGKMLGRLFSGESMFQNIYTAEGGQGFIAFASGLPGDIMPVHITPDNPIVVQKSAYLASEFGVEHSVHFQKKFSAGLFGGEGFIMQKLSGNGIAFLEIDGYAKEYQLAAGESMLIDTGYLAMMEATCTMEVQQVPGVKNVLFGGEGLFNTKVTGPGKIIIQSMPVSSLAGQLLRFMPAK